MSILVTYASKHGATQKIAERIAEKLRAAGLDAEVRPVKAAGDLAGYDAFVIGRAVYYESWLKEAANFVRRREAVLTGQPVWLFSSGPLGTAATDAQGRDLREVAEPKDIAGAQASHPAARPSRVLWGARPPFVRVHRTDGVGTASCP